MDEDEEFGINTKFVAQFLDIYRSGHVHFEDSVGAMHSHIVFFIQYAPLPHVLDYSTLLYQLRELFGWKLFKIRVQNF